MFIIGSRGLVFLYTHGGTGCGSAHKPFFASRASLSSLSSSVSPGVLPVPPAPAIIHELMIDVGTIREKDIGQRPPIFVLAVSLEDDISSED